MNGAVLKIAVAISGSGRSLENLLTKQKHGQYEVACVISSNPKCRGNNIASEYKLPLLIEDFKTADSSALRDKLKITLQQHQVNLVVLAGFLKPWPILAEIDAINIHPALLPKYGGKGMYGHRVHEQVLAKRDRESGATIHVVTEDYDKGSIIAQKSCSIVGLESADDIAKRVFALECEILPATLNHIARDGGLRHAIEKGVRYDV